MGPRLNRSRDRFYLAGRALDLAIAAAIFFIYL
jgi:hypothetical protein